MSGDSPFPTVSIFEAETLLQEALNLLKRPEYFERVKAKIVGDFWDKGWTRAPFEECMTFKQLSSIQFDHLIRKRSFDCDKMVALSLAIRRAVGVSTESSSSLQTEPNKKEESQVESSKRGNQEELPSIKDLPSTSYATYLGLSQIIHSIPEGHSLGIGSQKIFSSLPPDSLLAAWYLALFGDEHGAKLLKLPLKTFNTKAKKALEQIASIFHYAAPECYLHWSTALTGAGASTHYLMSPYLYAKGVPQECMHDLCIVFLKAIGAKEVKLKKGVLLNHYSLTPETAQQILSALKFPKKASKATLISIVSLPFPFFDHQELIASIQ